MSTFPFAIRSDVAALSVFIEGEAVTRIEFGGEATRAPDSGFERQVAEEIAEYLDGSRTEFTFAIKPAGTEFQMQVWEQLTLIPYGATATYGEIAARLGDPALARAVGGANNRNPIPVVIPCHRVVGAGGKLGGFGGGLELKKRLLSLESSHSPAMGLT